jgi:hypothetical protein
LNDYDAEYRRVAAVLMDYGGIVAPVMLGGEWQALLTLTDEVLKSPPTDDQGRREVERKFDELVGNPAFHPNYRAHLTSRATTLPHLSRCSHLVERAVLHYYKGDFLSCVLVLLPAVEGTLRSYMGLAESDPSINWKQVRDALQAGTPETHPQRRAMYADALSAFHERWFWARTSTADFSLSYLNRHYALHAIGTGSYYRATDCHRLFLYFDTFADMLMLEGHGPKHVFLPESPEVRRRRDYYFSLLLHPPSLPIVQKVEAQLLAEHPNFVPEERPPSVSEMFSRFARVMGMADPPARRKRDGLRGLYSRLLARLISKPRRP